MKIWISATSVRRYLKLQSLLFFFLYWPLRRPFGILLRCYSWVGPSMVRATYRKPSIKSLLKSLVLGWYRGGVVHLHVLDGNVLDDNVLDCNVLDGNVLGGYRNGVILKNTSWMVMARIAVSKKSDHRIQAWWWSFPANALVCDIAS